MTGCELYPFNCSNAAIVINPAQPSTLYVPLGSAIYKTTDGGDNWTTLPTLPGNVTTPTYLTLDPAKPDHLFAVAFNYNFRSFDGGQSWTQFFPPAKNPGNSCGATVAFDPVHANIAYFVDHCELFRSSDSGVTWTTFATPFQNIVQISASPRSGTLYGTAFNGIYSTDDGGVTWTLVKPIPPQFQGEIRILAIDPATGQIVTSDSVSLGRFTNAVIFDPAQAGRAIAVSQGGSTAFLARLDYSGTVIDATYFGGQGTTNVVAMAVDRAGNIYLAGNSNSPDFPVTTTIPHASTNSFVAGFDGAFTLRYATWTQNLDVVTGIATDSSGRAVVATLTPPTPTGQWQCVATKLSPDGADTVFRTAAGTSVQNCVVASDSADNTILAGTSFQGGAIVYKLDPAGNTLFSAPAAGKKGITANALAVDASANIYVAGNISTNSSTGSPGACPYPSNAVATGIIGTIYTYLTDDVFISKLDPAGNLLASTQLGGICYDVARGLSLDPQGNVWITGITQSSPFPQAAPIESGPPFASYKAFVARFDSNLTAPQLSSYLSAGNQPSIATDAFGNAYIAGTTTPPLSPYSGPPAPPKYVTGVQASLAKVELPPAAALAITSAGNAFSLRDGPVSPGQITLLNVTGLAMDSPADLTLTPTAPLPRSLAGVQVLFDGESAALVSVAPGRVVAVAPYSLASKQQTGIHVLFNGALSAPLLADVLPDPSFLSRDGSGTGQAYAINADGTQNTPDNPALQNTYVTIFETGTGSVPSSCPEGGVDPASGYLCGILKTQIRTPNYGVSTVAVPNSPVTISVK